DVEPVLHGHVHALAGLGGVGVAGVAGDEHARGLGADVFGQDVVEAVGQAVADLVHAVPGDVAHVDGVGVHDGVGLGDDLLDAGLAHVAVVVLRDDAEVDVHAEEVPALARDEQDGTAVVRLDGALGADIGEVGLGQDVHDAPGVVGLVAGHGAADGGADLGAGAVAADDVLGVDGLGGSLVRAGAADQADLDGMVALVGHLQALEVPAVVRGEAGGGVAGDLGEVVQHAGLVDDQVLELADAGLVVLGAAAAHDVRGVLGVRAPEGHLGDPVGLGGDGLGEAERLERLDGAGLDAVGLADLQAAAAAFDQAGGDVGELGELGGGEHAGRSGADDEHVDLLGQLLGAVDA